MPQNTEAGTFVLESTTFTLESAIRPFLRPPDPPSRERISRPSPETNVPLGDDSNVVATEPVAPSTPTVRDLREDIVVSSPDSIDTHSGSYAPGFIVPAFILAFAIVAGLAVFAARLWRRNV